MCVLLQQFFQRPLFSSLPERTPMGAGHFGELRPKPQLREPDRGLIGAEFRMGQLHVQQPVIEIVRARPSRLR
jgi:hypothetical protein